MVSSAKEALTRFFKVPQKFSLRPSRQFHESTQTNVKNIFNLKETYIRDVHMEMGWGGLEICHVFADSIVFKQ